METLRNSLFAVYDDKYYNISTGNVGAFKTNKNKNNDLNIVTKDDANSLEDAIQEVCDIIDLLITLEPTDMVLVLDEEEELGKGKHNLYKEHKGDYKTLIRIILRVYQFYTQEHLNELKIDNIDNIEKLLKKDNIKLRKDSIQFIIDTRVDYTDYIRNNAENVNTGNILLRKDKMSKEKVKQAVWEMWCSDRDDVGKCFCCHEPIKRKLGCHEFGHVIADSKEGGYTVDNIRPVCLSCNRGVGGMGTKNMYLYMIQKNMPGLINLKAHEKQEYLYDCNMLNKNFKKAYKCIRDCKEITDSFKEQLNMLISETDVRSPLFQNTLDYVLKL